MAPLPGSLPAPLDDIPTLKAWHEAYAAFRECAGCDVNTTVQYSTAWAAAMNAVMAYAREINSCKVG